MIFLYCFVVAFSSVSQQVEFKNTKKSPWLARSSELQGLGSLQGAGKKK
jgi:hypothetical protein